MTYNINILFNHICEYFNNNNIACNLKIQKKTKNITNFDDKLFINISLFKTQDNINNLTEKFKSYLIGLSNQLKLYNNKNKYIIRLFFDFNIINDKRDFVQNFIKNCNDQDNIEIILFKFNDFLIPNTNMHKGLFATLIRFLILFDFDGNNLYNLILDADMTYYKFFIDKSFYILKSNNFVLHTLDCYQNIKRLLNIDVDLKIRIFANMFSKQKLDKKILIDFFKCLKDRCLYHNDWENFSKGNTYKYGIDEYFVNKYLLTEIMKYKNVICKIVYFGSYSVPDQIERNIKNNIALQNDRMIINIIKNITKDLDLNYTENILTNLNEIRSYTHKRLYAPDYNLESFTKIPFKYYQVLHKYNKKYNLVKLKLIDKDNAYCINFNFDKKNNAYYKVMYKNNKQIIFSELN
jgi:hypothetical protein